VLSPLDLLLRDPNVAPTFKRQFGDVPPIADRTSERHADVAAAERADQLVDERREREGRTEA
jgi:hypothetical protein